MGQILKNKRLALGATLEQIAFEAGMDASNLSRIERGMQLPSSELLKRIADALGSNIGQLYDEPERDSETLSAKPAAKYDKHTQQLLRQFGQLDAPNQKLALEFIKLLGRLQPKPVT